MNWGICIKLFFLVDNNVHELRWFEPVPIAPRVWVLVLLCLSASSDHNYESMN